MSRASVVEFCKRVAQSPELRNRLESGVRAGAGWDLLVSIGHEHGFDFTAEEAAECFESERQRRAACESASHNETTILKKSRVPDTRTADTFILRKGVDSIGAAASGDVLNLSGLRRVALSQDWNIELSTAAKDDDASIFDE